MDVYLLTINKDACKAMLKHLKENGFDEVEVVEGIRPQKKPTIKELYLKETGSDKVEVIERIRAQKPTKPTIKELHECICAGHYKCTKKFSVEGKRPHFILFEDDCRFTIPNAYAKIMEAIRFLDASVKWGSLHVGQTPLGPIFPVRGAPFLCRTMNPYAAHCYVLNGEMARRLIEKIPKEKWKRPHVQEGWKQIPAFERFAFFPSIAIQNNNPKEMRRIVGNALSYKTGVRIIEGLAFTLTGIGFILLILATCLLFFWVYNRLKILKERGTVFVPPPEVGGTR